MIFSLSSLLDFFLEDRGVRVVEESTQQELLPRDPTLQVRPRLREKQTLRHDRKASFSLDLLEYDGDVCLRRHHNVAEIWQKTSNTMCTVLMVAACFPEEQVNVQAELDAAIGRHRGSLVPYRNAMVLIISALNHRPSPTNNPFLACKHSSLRWRPPVPDGLAHRTIKDVIWLGPRYTATFGDQCASRCQGSSGHCLGSICRDPDVFPEPDTLNPQRWIDVQGSLRDDIKLFVFGFGRRVCPGQHVASRSVFITALLILWAFKLTLDPMKPLQDMG
ncbi:cytochrome P450, partial [Suillus americanus]